MEKMTDKRFIEETFPAKGNMKEKGKEAAKTTLSESMSNLDHLLAGVVGDNLHQEVDTGPAAGKETW